jgi:hypothetical protein
VFWHTTPVDLQVTQLPVYSVYWYERRLPAIRGRLQCWLYLAK